MMRRSDSVARIAAVAVAVVAVAVFLAGCSGKGPIPEPAGVPRETTSTLVYFSTGRSLVEEERVVDAADVYRTTLEQLLAAKPRVNPDIAIVQPQAGIRSVAVKDGIATIDWSRDVLAFQADPAEKRLALASFLRTLGQFPEVREVRFTVEGKTAGALGGKDVEAFWGEVSLKGQPWKVIRPSEGTGAPSKK